VAVPEQAAAHVEQISNPTAGSACTRISFPPVTTGPSMLRGS